MTSFQVTLGAMIDSVLWLAVADPQEDGMKPNVPPSFRSVE